MKCHLLGLIFLFAYLVGAPIAGAQDSCCKTAVENPLSPSAQSTATSLATTKANLCQQLANSERCQQVYADIDQEGHESSQYRRTCSPQELKVDDEILLLSGQRIWGCAMGVADAAIVDFGQTLGETAAKIVTDREIENYCNSHIDYKRLLFLIHNSHVAKNLRIKVPPDEELKKYDCSQWRTAIKEQYENLLRREQYDRKSMAKPAPDDGVHLLQLAKSKLKELGVEIECYNPQRAAELICKVASYTAMTVALPLSVASRIKLAAGLATESTELAEMSRFDRVLERTRTTTARLIAKLDKGIGTPIDVPAEVHVEEVAETTVRELDRVKRMGIEGRETKIPTQLRENVVWRQQTKLIRNAGQNEDYGVVYLIDKLPKSLPEIGPQAQALTHPEMAAYKAKLEAMGYRLAVDTSLPHTGADGYVWSFTKVLALRSRAPWLTFLHEFQHAEFAHFLERDFDTLVTYSLKGKPIQEALPATTVQQLGPQRIERLNSLIKKGLPIVAVNETLSVDAELAAMGFRRYLPARGALARQYALRHQINELNKVAKTRALTAIERKTLDEAILHNTLLKAYVYGGPAATISVPLAAAEIKGLEAYQERKARHHSPAPDDYQQIIYDENGHAFGQTKDGQWVALVRRQPMPEKRETRQNPD